MSVGAPLGNNNAAKGKLWTDAIKRALARRSDTVEGGLNDLADTFIEAVANGDAWAMKELGDRLEGKSAQSMDVNITKKPEDWLKELDD